MKLFLKIVGGTFAVIGLAYTALVVYASFFLPHCLVTANEEARSPDGRHFAIFQQRVCEDAARSKAEVTMGRRDQREQIVLLEIQGTTDVRLTWNGERELVVTLPASATVKRNGPYDGWPRFRENRLRSEQ